MSNKITITPGEIPTKDLHQYLLGSVAPRPIAFVSSVDEDGNQNLAPYSFFNAFSSNPPIVVFSANRRVRDNTTKDTLANVFSSKEVVINMVNYDIVRQMTLSSIEFPSDVSEFVKSGLTPENADIVKAPLVAESPVNMECTVEDVITLGNHGGAGHLIICHVKKIHISNDVLDDGKIDPHKIDLMGRMGRSFYVRASGEAIHRIYQPVNVEPIGYDRLPSTITKSTVLTANDVATLASQTQTPSKEEVQSAISKHGNTNIHIIAKGLISNEEVAEALALLYSEA